MSGRWICRATRRDASTSLASTHMINDIVEGWVRENPGQPAGFTGAGVERPRRAVRPGTATLSPYTAAITTP